MFSWIEVSESAIRHNLKQFKKYIGKDNLLMPVIKSNAYGHGFDLVAKICDSDKNVDRICVVNSDEALDLIKLKIKKPIVILSFYSDDKNELKKLINRGVVFPIYRIDQITLLNKVVKHLRKKIKVHIKIDTGTTRIGFLLNELPQIVRKMGESEWLNVEGMFSHFASSEEDPVYTRKQFATFTQASKVLKDYGFNPSLKHMACTAASLGFKFKDLNAMRLGLGLYGLYPDNKFIKNIKLKPALVWKTKIIQIKNLPPKTNIGYGCTFKTKSDIKLAVLPVGYWDGYGRSFSNIAQVIIKRRLCPVRGRVCMNLMMVEIPKNLKIKVGDVAILLGRTRNDVISAEHLAKLSNTINYEVVTKINPLLPRIKVK